MNQRGSDGKRVVVFLLVAVAAGFVVRWRCHRADDAPPPTTTPPVVPPTAKPPDAAVVAAIDAAAEPEPARRYRGTFALAGISADGTHALLESTTRIDSIQLRAVAIETNKVEADLALDALADVEHPASAAADVARALAVLRGFPLGAAHFGRIAASPDAARGALNAVDDTYLFADGKLGAKLPFAAAYEPLVLPDGKTLLVRGYDGRTSDGDGKYSLFAAPLAGGKPAKVAGTDAYGGVWALSKAGVLRIVVGQGPLPTCVLEIPLEARPLRVTKRVCPERADPLDVVLSPSGDWIVWQTSDGDGRRNRSMELASERVDLDAAHDGQLHVSDRGVVVIAGITESVVWDPDDRRLRPVPAADPSCVFRGDDLVCPTDDGVRVVKLR